MRTYGKAAPAVINEEGDEVEGLGAPGTNEGDFSFTVAAKRSGDPDVECHAAEPLPGAVALAIAATGRRSSTQDSLKGIIDFFFGALYPESATYLQERLFDSHDRGFDFDELEEIVSDMLEEWGRRPTRSSSGSSSRRTNTGKRSTGSTPK